ncbi:MAG: hypothetical protein QOG73_3512, partial [Acetobacteraceae bacterium]|nr:hypothetical protein [Acetobacteraceae bacterium]
MTVAEADSDLLGARRVPATRQPWLRRAGRGLLTFTRRSPLSA